MENPHVKPVEPPLAAPPFRRRHYFIDRGLQGSFLLRLGVAVCVTAGLAGWVVYFSFASVLEEGMFSAHVSVSHTGELFRGRLVATNLVLATALLLMAIVFVARVARGCGFALKRARVALARLAEGDLSVEVWAKRSDHLDELFAEINSSIGHARAYAQQARSALDLGRSELRVAEGRPPDLAAGLRGCAAALRMIGPRR